MFVLAGCGGSSPPAQQHPPPPSRRSVGARSSPSGELISVPALGRFYGHCDLRDSSWTLTFAANPTTATDSVTYRGATGRPHTVTVNPGKTLRLRLAPGRFTSHERPYPPGHFTATTVKTTAPVTIDVTQATEPHTFRVQLKLALAAAIGDTANCALVSSNLSAATYYPGGPPPG